jgi:hypothetical protein
MTHFYRRQPPRGTKVAGNSPLGRGISAHFTFNGTFESSVRGKPANPIVTAGPVFKSDRNGQYVVGTGAGKVTTSLYAKDLGIDGSRARTFIAEFYMGDNNAPRALFSVGDTSTNARSQATLEINSNYRQVRFDTFGTDILCSLHSVTGTGARVFLAITYDGATTLTFQSYSKLDSTGQVIKNIQSFSTGSPLATGTTFPLTLMGGGTYGFASMISELYLLSIYGGRCLTTTEIDRLYADKHQVIAPPQMFPYTALAKPSLQAYLMSALPGAFAVSGADAGLRATRRLPAAAGSLALSTGSASLIVARRLAAGTGAYTVSGRTAALIASRRLVAGPGAFVVSSGSLQMIYAPAQGSASPTYILVVAPGSFAMAGAGTAIRYNRRLPAAPGAFGVSASAAALRTARKLRGDSATFAVTGSAVVLKYSSSAGAIDVSQIAPAHIAVFDGSGSRIAVFAGTGTRILINGMTMKLPTLVNGKMMVDRDPDEISWYGADITQELIDRATTPQDQAKIAPVLAGVALLQGPLIQTASVSGVTRTYVVVLLGGVDGALPDDWHWIARVPCANGERFDKTTYFNRVDT